MHIWALADLHLSFGVENKSMDYFGPAWADHANRIADHWKRVIRQEDLVLIPGDISWALKLEEAVPDLEWIHQLPGTKVLLKGNHDYWWGSLKKIVSILPPSIHLIQNNAFHWKGVGIAGARLWDTSEYNFKNYIEFRENPRQKKDIEENIQEDLSEKLFERELQRLKISLSMLHPDTKLRIAMTHYPPIGADLTPSRASKILEEHNIDIAVFGHLHNLKPDYSLFGKKNNIRYLLASSDYLRFEPICLYSLK